MSGVDTARIDQLDLKTLRLLGIVLETTSVTRTAEKLGMSQPAASRALERLRRALGDPLLIRARGGYALTARAATLRSRVATLLAAVDDVLAPEVFEPSTTRRSFRVGTTDYGAATAIADMAARFAQAAPKAQLDVVPFGPDTFERLERGSLDVALYADLDLPPDFHYRRLFKDSYACIVRNGHPLAQHRTAAKVVAALAGWPQAVMMYTDGSRSVPDDVLESLGVAAPHVALRTPYFMSAPWVIARTDLVMCVPLRIARRMADVAGMCVVPLPAEAASFDYRAIWHERAHRDPASQWIRRLLREE